MVTLVLIACLGAASPDAEAAPGPFVSPRVRTEHSFLVPAIEAALVDFSLAAFNNLVSQMSFAQISASSIESHLAPSSWTFDNDYFLTNQFGHPYQGSLSFIAARSSGLSFWWSLLYPFFASLAWELVFEVDRPSVNDQITTTLGGAFLGEVLFRLAGLFLDPTNDLPSWVRQTFAFLAAPVATANRALFDDTFERHGLLESPWYRGSFGGGTFVQFPTGVGAFITAHLVYGAPTDAPDAPFSHFDIRADLSLTRQQVTGDFDLRGLLWGRHFHLGRLEGVGGVFGAYEYVAPRVLRASSVNVGGGVTGQYSFSSTTALEFTLVGSGIAFGAAGYVGPSGLATNDGRDYHIGPGLHAVAEASLINESLGMLSVGFRRWNLFGGVYALPTGHDAITYLNASLTIRVGRHLTGTIEVVHALRDARFDPVTINQSITQLHVSIAWLFSDSLGVVATDRHVK